MKMEDMVLVSVDDHIVEPPTMWDNHLTVAQKSFAPKMHRDSAGVDFWLFEDRRVGAIALNAVAGRVREEYGCEPVSLDQMRKGAWDITSRVDDMNANGILASLNFPQVVRFDGSLFKEFDNQNNALTLVRAYNDWHIDEWCGSYPGRNIPMAITPFWDIGATVAEIKRVARKGCRAITFSDNPSLQGLPSIHNEHWKALWQVCADNDIVINIHIASGREAPMPSLESPFDSWLVSFPMAISLSAADWLYLSALQEYPNLKIFLSEGGIGWIPYFLERADFTFEHHGAWTGSDFGGRKPSEVFRDHFYCCFIDDRHGLRNIDDIGADNVCYEMDYPHSDTLWPKGPEYLHQSVGHLSDEVIDKITHRNALNAFGFDALGMRGGRENCTVAALRAQAAHVDVTPKSFGGLSPLRARSEVPIVTCGDIERMMSAR